MSRGKNNSFYEKITEETITMVTVYEFPVKVKLPKQIEERLYGIAWDYVDALYNALDNFYDEEKSDQEMLEVAEMVRETLVDGINDAVEHIYK